MFCCAEDYRLYLSLLGELAPRYGVSLRGFCLMANHVHLLPVPSTEDALARLLGLVHQRYSQVLNLRARQSGHCWQNRFFSCPLDAVYFVRALRYVERNPARARIVDAPWEYPWSSARAHCTGVDDTGLLELCDWSAAWPGESWREYLTLPAEPGEIELFRLSTTIGPPFGTDDFVTRLEDQTGRRLRPLAVGRPPKEKK